MDHGTTITRGGDRGEAQWLLGANLSGIPGLIHGFTLREAGDFSGGVPRDWRRPPGARELRLLRQVHEASVARHDDPTPYPTADAWAGRPPSGALLGIRTADCLPLLLCHAPSGTLGLAHAGWRSAAAGVVYRTLESMGCPPREVQAALGPAIGPCCYQVGPDVAEAVGSGRHLTGWPDRLDRFRLDLPGLVTAQLADAGVLPENLDRLAGCTACEPLYFFSHRARGETGRMCAFLGWRNS